jgi:hypothetical protein
MESLLCSWCSREIDTDERMVVLAEGEERETSPVEEQFQPAGDPYHRACFREAYGPVDVAR